MLRCLTQSGRHDAVTMPGGACLRASPVEHMTDWTDAYAISEHVPGAGDIMDSWPALAAAFRARMGARAEIDLVYGPHARNRYDLFHPEGAPRGLAVFVHGGYWMMLCKASFSHLAEGALEAGWAVALPSYTLAPEARIGTITAEIALATASAAARVDGPIRLAGHSAGGHLVTRMACSTTSLAPDVQRRIAHVLSISGVHDLRPLRATAMNETLRIDPDEARRESPALCDPVPGTALTTWVGSEERPEFLRQAALLANAWLLPGVRTRAHREPGRHHFDVLDGLTTRSHPLARALTGEDGWS